MRQNLPLDEPTIARLVDDFYDAIRADAVLGPIFDDAVEDWPEHKRILTTFWCSVALDAGTYRGRNPMSAHRPLPIRAGHFDRWLELWREACARVLPAEAVPVMGEYAERIARSLKYGLGIHPQSRGLGIPVVGAG